MRRCLTALVALTLCLACSGDTEAGLFRHRAKRCRVACATASVTTTTTTTATAGANYAPGYTPAAFYQPPNAGAFLQAVNALRASYGRGPVGWDAALASYAASNNAVHNGTGPQCWSSTGDLFASLSMWAASPPHLAIILNATTAIGASPCGSGSSLNCR